MNINETYSFFGLEKENASLESLKKSYYNLALLIHPDRNRCINRNIGCQEMSKLTQMYKQLSVDINNNEKINNFNNSNDLKEDNLKSQDELDNFVKSMPSFMDIYEETHDDIKKFNELWSKSMKDDHENNNGYNLLKSEYRDINDFENLEYNFHVKDDDNLPVLNKPENLDIVSIDDLGTNIINFGSDYSEAYGLPALLEERISLSEKEKFINPKEILNEFQIRENLYKND